MENYQERIGEGLVRIGSITSAQCQVVLEKQRSGDKRLFGEIALELGYIDFDSLLAYLSGNSKGTGL